MTTWIRSIIRSITIIWIMLYCGCQPLQLNRVRDRLTPSNERNWTPELAILPQAILDDEWIHLRNIRNINYLSDDNFVVEHFDRTIRRDDIQSVDFVVTPFKRMPAIAHTMLSFGLRDGSYLGLSVEIRPEVGEKYSPFLGVGRQFEITYVIADEKDLIRVRTRHRDADVYIYPTIATPEQAQLLFVDVLHRVNKLAQEPEFYDTITNNCTTNLFEHVNNMNPERIAYNWRILFPGFSAEYAYQTGLLDKRIPFQDLKLMAHVNDLAETYYDEPNFSQLIRSKQRNIERLAERQARFDISRGAHRMNPGAAANRTPGIRR